MPTVPDIHRRDTRANQASFTNLTVGTLHFVTDEGVTERWNGTTWDAYSAVGGGAPAAHHASHETGGGDALTALSAAVLTSGTVPDARFPATLPAASGANLTALNASNLASGTVPSARLPIRIGAIGLVIDGNGSAITTGVKGFLEVPFACTITAVTLLSTDASATAGSIVIDIWKDTYANYPPTVADTMTASAKPTLSSANKSRDTTLTGWTTSINAGDILGFTVDSATTVTKVALSLTVSA